MGRRALTAIASIPIDARERAEIVRSDIEASLTRDEQLAIDAATLRRYRAPSAEAFYPLEYAYHLLGDLTGCRALDLGCGSGRNAVLMALKGASVTGVDISRPLLALAAARAAANGATARTRLVAASAHSLPFASESFDVVFGVAILHHLDLPLVSREVHRVLTVGGRAVFSEPVRNSRLIRRLRPWIPYRAPDISPFEAPLTDEQVGEFASGFRPGRRRAFWLPHVSVARVTPGVRAHLHKVHRIDAALLRWMPRLASFAGRRVWEIVKESR
jgi:SAM-dependent methyltransferase